MRFAMRLAVMALGGMAVFGLGKSPQQEAPCLQRQGVAAVVEMIGQGAGLILSPALARAAIADNSANQTGARQVSQTKQKVTKKFVAKRVKGRGQRAASSRGETSHQASWGRCEPQSLTYARQRSGIMRSRTGRENGPLTWFSSERKLGKTSGEPVPGSVLILGAQGHGMPTGHVAYVEKVYPDGDSSYRIVFSHTNYDRRCSLETGIEALYNSSAMTLDIFSGAWKAWGSGLRVAGFIQE